VGSSLRNPQKPFQGIEDVTENLNRAFSAFCNRETPVIRSVEGLEHPRAAEGRGDNAKTGKRKVPKKCS